MPSAMQETMARQPSDLRALSSDLQPIDRAATRLRACSRVLLVGTGTSWHAAAVGAWFLRDAGVEAWAVPSSEASAVVAAIDDAGVIAISHSGAAGASQSGRPKVATQGVVDLARGRGLPLVTIGARGVSGADLETVERETSSAHTASYLGALLRIAQLAGALGRPMDGLDRVPDVVADALASDAVPTVEPPHRLIEFVGSGVNTSTAAEGALKVREAARIASEGLGAEQCLHGPLVALDERDALVALDEGDDGAARVRDVAKLAHAQGVRTYVVRSPSDVAAPLSVFPLTVAVQRIALGCAEALGTDPDAFGFDVPGRRESWSAVPL